MDHTKRTRGFTLLELVIVVTILSILSLIAVFTYSSYNAKARDGQRVEDIGNISKSMEMYLVKNIKLPTPTGGINVTYLGQKVWTQGTFGANVLDDIENPSPLPHDPQYGVEYTYSLLNTDNEFSIGGILENIDQLSIDTGIRETVSPESAYAAKTLKNAKPFIQGNYNGMVAKVETGSLITVLALPSIIVSDLSKTTLEGMIASSGNVLVSQNLKNLPTSFAGKDLDMTGSYWTLSSLGKGIGSMIVWSGTSLPKNESGSLLLINNLKIAYSGTVSNISESISPILSLTDSQELIDKSNDIVLRLLGGEDPTISLAGGGAGVSTPVSIPGFTSIAMGSSHACGITISGGAKCWGWNIYGQLGSDTGTLLSATPLDVIGLSSGVKAITVGTTHSCAVMNDGTAKCWGRNEYGQLGNGTGSYNANPIPTDVSSLGIGTTSMISAGYYYTCALTTSGGVKCWGRGAEGQLGNGSTSTKYLPTDASGLTTGVMDVEASSYGHSCGLTSSGGVKCWGLNAGGQLGNSGTTTSLVPVDSLGLTGNIVQISLGSSHTCARDASKNIYCWGDNTYGQLGNGGTGKLLVPTYISSLGSNITSLGLGAYHSCVTTSSGGVKCWGYNANGQIGIGSAGSNLLAPTDVPSISSGALSAAIGGYSSCAIFGSGGAKCWGWDNYGQLGNGLASPTPIPQDNPSFSSGVSQIAMGYTFACVLTTSGGVKCYGSNSNGQLGNGGTGDSTTPVDVIGLTGGVSSISLGASTACAKTISGGMKCWGANGAGQLGNGTKTLYTGATSTPVDVIGLTGGVSQISVGWSNTCAVTNSGALKCWGDNSYGQMGSGSTGSAVMTPTTVGTLTGVTSVSVGGGHTCAIVLGGLKCWGFNYYGEVGTGWTDIYAPISVPGLGSGVLSISAGSAHTCGLKTGGTVFCFGDNENQAASGDGLTGIVSVSAGNDHTCAKTDSGGAKCWGWVYPGQIGYGEYRTIVSVAGPTDVYRLTSGVSDVIAGAGSTSCAITSSGGLKCWGSDSYGLLGTGFSPYSPVNVLLN